MTKIPGFLAFAVLAIVAQTGCVAGSSDPLQNQTDDLAQYDALQASLKAHRQTFSDRDSAVEDLGGTKAYWFEGQGDPELVSYDASSKVTTRYSFSAFLADAGGSTWDNRNVAVSPTFIATMNGNDTVRAYSADAANNQIGELQLPMPQDGEKWWAYTADGDYVYIAIKGDDSAYHVQRWQPGSESTTDMGSLDAMITPNEIGDFVGLVVHGDQVMFDETGRMWLGSFSTHHAAWVQNHTEIAVADFTTAGAFYADESGTLWNYDAANDDVVSISDAIAANSYQLNATFSQAHLPFQDAEYSLNNDTLVYRANSGLFSYNLATDTVAPIALDARDNSEVNRYPEMIEHSLFELVLESTDGATGADGTAYCVSL